MYDHPRSSLSPRRRILLPLLLAGLTANGLLACEADVSVLGRRYDPYEESRGQGGSGYAPATDEEFAAACNELCQNGQPDCDIWWGFCETQCESVRFAGCEGAAVSLMQCLADLPPEQCRLLSSPCEVDLFNLVDCLPLDACERGATVINPGTCSASGVCGSAIVSQDCYALDEETFECVCYRGTEAVYTCDVTNITCDLTYCCGRTSL